MTLKELYIQGKKELTKAGTDSPAFDAICIFEYCTGINRQSLIINGDTEATIKQIHHFLKLIEKRTKGNPLQYLLGKWEFMGLPFLVGPGVLIPREDTTVSVEKCITLLENISSPKILDLCAGTGAIGITIAKKFPHCKVTAVEFSSTAFKYLKNNILLNNISNVTPIKADVLRMLNLSCNSFDLIVSNPPYIKTGDIISLQKEVQKEPKMALDGGEDGYYFYNKIIKLHTPLLKSGGTIVFEVGENQYKTVMGMLKKNNYTNINFLYDLGNIERTVYGTLK